MFVFILLVDNVEIEDDKAGESRIWPASKERVILILKQDETEPEKGD